MNLNAYLNRIGFEGTPGPDFQTLEQLQRLHPIAIPFENLSTLLGEPVRLDIGSLEAKLIHDQRGGYCFEQNSLFQHVLEAIGFSVLPLAARVVWNPGHINPRTHMAMLVDIGEQRWLCDIGFGGATLTAPLEFVAGVEQDTPHERFRILAVDQSFELQIELDGRWRPMYRFDLQRQFPIDYEALNHYVATWPGSHFRHVLMAGRPDSDGRHALFGNRYTRIENGAEAEAQTICTAMELRVLLTDQFHIRLPAHPGLDTALARIAGGGDSGENAGSGS